MAEYTTHPAYCPHTVAHGQQCCCTPATPADSMCYGKNNCWLEDDSQRCPYNYHSASGCSWDGNHTPIEPTEPAKWVPKVGDRVEWPAVPAVDGMGFERSPRTGQVAAVGPSVCLVWDGIEYHQVAPHALRRPSKRLVTQAEYVHVSGSKQWIDEPAGVGHVWTPTGRTHEYEVDDE